MALPMYLAMTAAEISACGALPPQLAFMACHFSPYGTGLSNFPEALPKNSMLILNDRTPVLGHDPQLIAAQLTELAEQWQISSVLLDFQRPEQPRTAAIAGAVLDALTCPVGITEYYAKDLYCPVFLSPPPLHQPLEVYLAPWAGRELWLEAALDSEVITVTEAGSHCAAGYPPSSQYFPFTDERLHCRYHTQVSEEQIRFTLQRTPEDLAGLLQQAQELGIARAIGLYQELHPTHAERLPQVN